MDWRWNVAVFLLHSLLRDGAVQASPALAPSPGAAAPSLGRRGTALPPVGLAAGPLNAFNSSLPVLTRDTLNVPTLQSALIPSTPTYLQSSNCYDSGRVMAMTRASPLDHFAPAGPSNPGTFTQRYWVCDYYFDPTNPGPIMFYAGAEGDAEWTGNSPGFPETVASVLGNSLIVVAEHRYYGKSLPDKLCTTADYRYLQVEQALADYRDIVLQVQKDYNIPAKLGAFSFGGSYGGAVSAWLRITYPSVFTGALSSSGPVRFIAPDQQVPPFDPKSPARAISYAFSGAYGQPIEDTCNANIRAAVQAIKNASRTADGLDTVSSIFGGVFQLNCWVGTGLALEDWIVTQAFSSNFWSVAQYGGSSFRGLWPITVACQQFLDAPNLTGQDAMEALARVMFFNQDIAANSLQVSSSSFGASIVANNCKSGISTLAAGSGRRLQQGGCSFQRDDTNSWNYQLCTQIGPFKISANGVSDMFGVASGQQSVNCVNLFGPTVPPLNATWGLRWGVGDKSSYYTTPNIIYTNGKIDPWSAAGLLNNVTGSPAIVYVMKDTVHCADLSYDDPPPPCIRPQPLDQPYCDPTDADQSTRNGHDPADLLMTRRLIIQQMQGWAAKLAAA